MEFENIHENRSKTNFRIFAGQFQHTQLQTGLLSTHIDRTIPISVFIVSSDLFKTSSLNHDEMSNSKLVQGYFFKGCFFYRTLRPPVGGEGETYVPYLNFKHGCLTF